MKVVVVKDSKESNERLITRFNKAVQKSRKVMKVRTTRYHKKSPTKRMIRAAAVMRDMYRAKREKNKFY
jgi:RNA polymerase-interacting CarD/CdnL/TRCF family regulator